MPWLSLLYNFLRNFALPFLQETDVPILLLFTELVRQHDRYLINNRVVATTFRAKEQALLDRLVFRDNLEQFKRVVLVYWTCKYVKHRFFHFRSKYTGEPEIGRASCRERV